MATAATSSDIVNRMVRAAKLEVPLYEEVEADVTATNQALLIVLLVALASGIGAAIGAAPGALVGRLVGGIVTGLIGWAVWSYVLYFVGTRFFGGTATYGELLRTLGFASTPRLLGILSFVPVVGWLIALAAGIWSLVASFIGIRQALDIDNTKTVFTILIGLVAIIIVSFVIGLVLALIFGAGVAAGSLLGQP